MLASPILFILQNTLLKITFPSSPSFRTLNYNQQLMNNSYYLPLFLCLWILITPLLKYNM